MWKYVCYFVHSMYVCVYVCVYLRTLLYMMCLDVNVCGHLPAYFWNVCVCVCTCVCVCACVCMCVCVCVRARTHACVAITHKIELLIIGTQLNDA